MDADGFSSSTRIFSSIAGKKTRQTRGYVDQVAAQHRFSRTISTAARSKKLAMISCKLAFNLMPALEFSVFDS